MEQSQKFEFKKRKVTFPCSSFEDVLTISTSVFRVHWEPFAECIQQRKLHLALVYIYILYGNAA